MSPDMNGGYCDEREDEREALDVIDRQCGTLILKAATLCQQSQVRIERTSDKWKAMSQ
jgi:hypothetical protein